TGEKQRYKKEISPRRGGGRFLFANQQSQLLFLHFVVLLFHLLFHLHFAAVGCHFHFAAVSHLCAVGSLLFHSCHVSHTVGHTGRVSRFFCSIFSCRIV